jgi:type IV pilus biogenesis protein CpaD/CtpE
MSHRHRSLTVLVALALAATAGCSSSDPAPATTTTTPAASTTTEVSVDNEATEAALPVPKPLSTRRPEIRTDPAQLARRFAAEYFAGVPIDRLVQLATDDYAKALFIGRDDDTRRTLRVAADPAINTGKNIWVVTLTTWTSTDDTSPDTRVAAVTVAPAGDEWRVARLAVEL